MEIYGHPWTRSRGVGKNSEGLTHDYGHRQNWRRLGSSLIGTLPPLQAMIRGLLTLLDGCEVVDKLAGKFRDPVNIQVVLHLGFHWCLVVHAWI
jgi:hypothetical protein